MRSGVYTLSATLLATWFRVMRWSLSASGLEHVPRRGPVVIVSNHVSHLDPVILGVALLRRPRTLAFLAKRELFEHRLLGLYLRSLAQIEVDRGGGAAAALAPALERLRDGAAVCIFPEGTISTAFVPAPPRPGAAKLALAASTPIVPAAVWGGQRIVTKDHANWWRRGVRLSLLLGEPIAPLPEEDPRHLIARVWDRVSTLVDELARSYPDRPEPGDDSWVPAHLGGSAPTVEEALARARAEADARRARKAGGAAA